MELKNHKSNAMEKSEKYHKPKQEEVYTDTYWIKDMAKTMNHLLSCEKHFYRRQKKSNFDICKYFNILKDLFTNKNGYISYDYNFIFYTEYTKQIYYAKIYEILDRLIFVNENFNINDIIKEMVFSYELLYSIRNTSLFANISEYLCNIANMKNVAHVVDNMDIINDGYNCLSFEEPMYYISTYIDVYITVIISNHSIQPVVSKISDDKFINSEIELFKKIIDNLFALKYNYDIDRVIIHLFNYKNRFSKENKDKQTYFCNTLFNYIMIDLNFLETIEYKHICKYLSTNKKPIINLDSFLR